MKSRRPVNSAVGHALVTMQRNLVTLAVAASLDFVLVLLQATFGIHVIVANFDVAPTAIAVVIGFVIGLCAERSAWWLAAVCVLPTVILDVFLEPVGAHSRFSFYVVDCSAATAVAFLVSRFRRHAA